MEDQVGDMGSQVRDKGGQVGVMVCQVRGPGARWFCDVGEKYEISFKKDVSLSQ